MTVIPANKLKENDPAGAGSSLSCIIAKTIIIFDVGLNTFPDSLINHSRSSPSFFYYSFPSIRLSVTLYS